MSDAARSHIHRLAVLAVSHELTRAGFRPRHTARLEDLMPGEFQDFRRVRAVDDLMPCDLVANVGGREVFIKAAGARTNFTSSHRFLVYAGEAGHDYLIVSTGTPVHERMAEKFPGGMARLRQKKTTARITHLRLLREELRTLAGKQPHPRHKKSTSKARRKSK